MVYKNAWNVSKMARKANDKDALSLTSFSIDFLYYLPQQLLSSCVL
jgi:hypothetical protein